MKDRPWREAACYAALVVLPLLLLAWLLDLRDLRRPLQYGVGDSLSVQLWVKGLLDNPWLLHNAYLGSPDGQDLHDYPTADSLHFLLIKLVGLAAGDVFTTINLYFLLGFPLTAVTTFFVLRRFEVSRGPAMLAALLYAFLPYHFLRGVGHLFLASYFLLPLVLWLALRLYLDRGPRRTWKGGLAAVAVCLLTASSGIYYAYFACFLLLVAGAAAAVGRRCWSPLGAAGVLVAVIGAGVAANVAPAVVYRMQHGPNRAAVERVPLNAELAGLKVTYLLMPVAEHRLKPLAKFRTKYDVGVCQLHLPMESCWASLGLLGSAGFLFLLGRAVLGRDRDGLTLTGGLATLNLASLLLSTIGGLGVFVALFGGHWIRCYERFSVVVAFFSLCALALLLDRWQAGRRRWVVWGGLGALLVLGVLDQTAPGCWLTPTEAMRAEFDSDAAFVRRIEASAPEGAMVFQLPHVRYPEAPPSHRMGSYDHARGYLHSRSLRWSFGAMKGRRTAARQERTASLPPAEMVRRLTGAGFAGIYVDRQGYADGGAALEGALTRLLGAARFESDNGRLVYYDLDTYRVSAKGR